MNQKDEVDSNMLSYQTPASPQIPDASNLLPIRTEITNGANGHQHCDPLLGCQLENCTFCNYTIPFDDGEESDGNSSYSARFLTPELSTPVLNQLEDEFSDSDSSLSSFTNLYSACSDAIEQMRDEEVRWFYKYENDKQWTPFLGYDSLRIEKHFKELKCLTADAEQSQEGQTVAQDLNVEKIYVRGGLYEVDITSRKCSSIYWKDECFSLLRGIWFFDGSWQPLDESSAEQIEECHMTAFSGKKWSDFVHQTPSKGPKQVILNIQLPNFHIDWNSPREVYLFSETTPSKIMRSVISRLGLQKSGYRLHRGYSEEATLDDKPAEITHLVFVIHGIGQKGETDKIIRNCSKMRDCSAYLKSKYFPTLQNSSERSEFFPVEWRSSLHLDGGIVESVTPNKIRGLRELLNRTAMDIMYYTSPLFRTEIVNCLTSELNRLYDMFTQRNPSFEKSGGKVSIVAHSLGCVIMYDILTGFNPVQLYLKDLQPSEEPVHGGLGDAYLQEELEKTRRRVLELEAAVSSESLAASKTISNLHFSIENFFCLGSPLAVFLALRGVRPKEGPSHDIVPSTMVKRMFNIYHPSDPVAYRLEPLVLDSYANCSPVQIHYYGSAEKQSYENAPWYPLIHQKDEIKEKISKETEEVRTPEKHLKESKWNLWSSWRKRGSPTPLEQELQVVMREVKETSNLDVQTSDCMLESDQPVGEDSAAMAQIQFRLDYVLREGNLGSSGYLAAFTAHTSYWTSYDVGYFLLTYLHPGLGS